MSLDPTPPAPNQDVEYFQNLADGVPIMIWMSDRSMGCFYFNRAWLDYRGRTLEEEFGNGWAEGVHPDDLEQCVQHYIGSFERRVAFAMSYRLRRYSGDYRWILDRGAPHFDADGEFLGFYGGCAETHADIAVERIGELRTSLHQMRSFAERVATAEASAAHHVSSGAESLQTKARRLYVEHRARQHAASQIQQLATDMLVYDRIQNGACLR